MAPDDIWAVGQTTRSLARLHRSPGYALMHWTGRAWRRIGSPLGLPQGVEVAGTHVVALSSRDARARTGTAACGFPATVASGAISCLYHYRSGHWARQLVPSEGHGSTGQLNALSWGRGANFGWAGGITLPGDGSSEGILLKYIR